MRAFSGGPEGSRSRSRGSLFALAKSAVSSVRVGFSCHRQSFTPDPFDSPFMEIHQKRAGSTCSFVLAMGYKKDIFTEFAYDFELSHKSRRKPCISSIPQELHIIKTKFCISSLRKGMQPAADDIHLR